MRPHFLLPTEKYHDCTLVPTWTLTCLLSGLSAVTRSPEGVCVRSFSNTFSCRSVSSVCSTGKKTPHISFRVEQGLFRSRPVAVWTLQSASTQSSHEVRGCCSSSSAEAEMFTCRFFKERAVRSGPAALALNLEVSMLRPAKWHKLHAVIIPQRHVTPGLDSLLRQKKTASESFMTAQNLSRTNWDVSLQGCLWNSTHWVKFGP